MFHLKKILIDYPTIKNNVIRLCSLHHNNLTEWLNIKSNYSPQQLKKIINTLSKINQAELKSLGFSDEKIQILESKKNGKKKYESLDDLIASNVMQPTELDKLCSSLITKVEKKSKKIISPAIGRKKLESIETAVGLRIKDRYISWSQLKLNGSQCSLLNWECHELTELSSNAKISQIIQKVKTISEAIPDTDAYIMEKDSSKPAAKISVGIMRSAVQHQQLLSIILTLLSTKNDLQDESSHDFFNSLYTMRSYTYAQLFQLFIGNEIVSAVDVVNHLIRNNSHDSLKYVTSICVDDKIAEQYYSMDDYMKEELSRSLLLTLTFFESAIADVSK